MGKWLTSSRSTGGEARSTGGKPGLGSWISVASSERRTRSASALIFMMVSGVRSRTSPAGSWAAAGAIPPVASTTALGRPRGSSASPAATGLPSATSPYGTRFHAAADLEAEWVFGLLDDAMVSSSQGWSTNCKGIPLLTPILVDQTFWPGVKLTRELQAWIPMQCKVRYGK